MYSLSIFLPGVLLVYCLVRRHFASQRLRLKAVSHGCSTLPNYPHKDPLLGLDLLFQTWRDFHTGKLAEGLRIRHERCGRTFNTNNLGSSCIYTMDPLNILTITTSKFEDYGKSAWVGEASKHIGNGILMSDGAAWKQSRNRLRPIFTKTTLDETKMMEPHLEHLCEKIRKEQGKIIDFQELSTRLVLDIVTDFLFGQSTESLLENEDGPGRHFLSLVKKFEPPSGTFIAIGCLAWIELLPSYRRLISVVDGMKAFFRTQLQAVLSDVSRTSNGTSCFRMMMTDNIPVFQIQEELQNVFFASFDTTNALLCNLLEIVSRRQDIQARLRQEIEALGVIPPTKREIYHLMYLRYVLLEALRLYTPVTMHSRIARRDTILPRGGGPTGSEPVFVPAGATVNWSIYSLNRDPDLYGADWVDFKPERWETLAKAGSPRFFMPFGSGPRACMGREMATTEISYILVRLLQEFPVITSKNAKGFQEAKAVSFYNKHGVLISMQ